MFGSTRYPLVLIADMAVATLIRKKEVKDMSVVFQMQTIIAIIEQYELKSVIHTEAGDQPSIHLTDSTELKKFEAVQSRERTSIEYPTELWVEIDNVRVFTLVPFEVSIAS